MDFEQFIDDVKTFFSENLEDYIDAINAIKTDITVAYPSKYEVDLPDTFQNSESIVFYILPWDYEISELTNESDNFLSNIKIVVTFSKDTDTNLYKVAHRYMNAIYSLLNENNSMDNTVDYTMINGIHYESSIQQGMKSIEINIITNKEI